MAEQSGPVCRQRKWIRRRSQGGSETRASLQPFFCFLHCFGNQILTCRASRLAQGRCKCRKNSSSVYFGEKLITRGWPPSPPPLWPWPWWGGGHWGPRSWRGGGRSGSTPRRLGYLGAPTSAPPASLLTPSSPLLPSLCSSQVWTSFLLTQFPLLSFFPLSLCVYSRFSSLRFPPALPPLFSLLFLHFSFLPFFSLAFLHSSPSLSPTHFSLLLF